MTIINIKDKKERGFLLIELMTAMAVFILGVVSIFSLFSLSTKSVHFALGQTNAYLLTLENIEAVNSLEKSNISLLTPGKYEAGIKSNNEWVVLPKKGLMGHFLFSSNLEDQSEYNNEAESKNISFGEDQEGQPGNAARFNSNDSGVKIYHDFSLRIPKAVTISAFIRDTGTENSFIAGRYDYDTETEEENGSYLLKKENGDYVFKVFGESGGVDSITTNPSGDDWDHLVGVFDPAGSTIYIYLNGELKNSKQVSFNKLAEESNIDFTIGTANFEENVLVWDGLISSIRVYNRSLSLDQIDGLYNSYSASGEGGVQISDISDTEKLISSWNFNEKEKCMIHDNINLNHGYLENCTSADWVQNRFGKTGQALEFTGSNYIKIPNSDSLTFNDQLTISFWVKLPVTPPSQEMTILHKKSSNSNDVSFLLTFDGTDNRYRFGAANGGNALQTVETNSSIASPGEWQHVILSFNGSENEKKIYLDNDEKVTSSTSGYNVSDNEDFYVGQNPDGTNNFEGVIDDLRIYNQVLSDQERISIFSNQINYFLN